MTLLSKDMQRLLGIVGAVVAVALLGYLREGVSPDTSPSSAQSGPEQFLSEVVTGASHLADVLAKVQDAESAKAGLSDVQSAYERHIGNLKRLPEMKDVKVRLSQSSLDRIKQDMPAATRRFKAEERRLTGLRGLPIEFWRIVRVKSTDLMVAAGEVATLIPAMDVKDKIEYVQGVQRLFAEHGPDRVVSVQLEGMGNGGVEKALAMFRAAAPGATLCPTKENDIQGVTLGPIDDFPAFAGSLKMGRILSQDDARRHLRIQYGAAPLPADAAQAPDSAAAAAMRNLQKLQQLEQERLRRQLEELAPLDPNDPQFYAKLLKRIHSAELSVFAPALETLSTAKPPGEPTPETRQEMSAALRDIAISDQSSRNRLNAVRGLVRWSEEPCIEVLVEVLRQEGYPASDSEVRAEIYRALGNFRDARAAPTVAARLGHRMESDGARRCLIRLGTAAEDAVLAVVSASVKASAGKRSRSPSETRFSLNDEVKACTAGIAVLEEIGTKKSVPLLNTALGSHRQNVELCQRAKAALKVIRERERTGNSNPLRTWTDAAGKHTVEAEFVALAGDQVQLKKPNGQVISVALDQLSEADQEWLRASKR